MRLVTLVLLLSCSSAEAGDTLFWRPTSNWNEPSNWIKGRLPCSAETVVVKPSTTFDGVALPASFDVSVTGDVALRKLIIPKTGSLSLRNTKITLKRVSTCQDEGLASVTDSSVNSFTGVQPRPWNCPTNWRQLDGTPADRFPCLDDSAVFPPNNSFSWIVLDAHVKIGRLAWQGRPVDRLSDIPNYEKIFFKRTPSADLTVDFSCLAGNPERCPCQDADDSPLCIYPTTTSPSTAASSSSTAGVNPTPDVSAQDTSFPWPILVGALGGLILILIIVIVVVVVVIRRRRKYRYDNDASAFAIEPPPDLYALGSAETTSGFKNPLYNDQTFDSPIYDNDNALNLDDPEAFGGNAENTEE
ncbi:uncharacterized protein [Oscarella lobularis]|uniref:uncharacterized protein n=1 Tax=Oscarella lobularis TaxID=121494 RepID=UPI0033132BBA